MAVLWANIETLLDPQVVAELDMDALVSVGFALDAVAAREDEPSPAQALILKAAHKAVVKALIKRSVGTDTALVADVMATSPEPENIDGPSMADFDAALADA